MVLFFLINFIAPKPIKPRSIVEGSGAGEGGAVSISSLGA